MQDGNDDLDIRSDYSFDRRAIRRKMGLRFRWQRNANKHGTGKRYLRALTDPRPGLLSENPARDRDCYHARLYGFYAASISSFKSLNNYKTVAKDESLEPFDPCK